MTDRARAVEECFWQLSEILDVVVERREGWHVLLTPGAGGMRNGVIHAELEPEEADSVIAATIGRFSELGTPFRWHVGPSARPDDLAERLVAHGFEHIDTLAGMCIPTSRDVAEPDPAIVVSELTEEDEGAFADVIMSTLDPPPDGARETLLNEIRRNRTTRVQQHYAARLDGQLVGATTYARMRQGGFLQGAAVLEPSRGRGVYRQMIQKRLEALRAEGIELAVITARRSTSAPICARLGFEEVCEIQIYGRD